MSSKPLLSRRLFFRWLIHVVLCRSVSVVTRRECARFASAALRLFCDTDSLFCFMKVNTLNNCNVKRCQNSYSKECVQSRCVRLSTQHFVFTPLKRRCYVCFRLQWCAESTHIAGMAIFCVLMRTLAFASELSVHIAFVLVTLCFVRLNDDRNCLQSGDLGRIECETVSHMETTYIDCFSYLNC